MTIPIKIRICGNALEVSGNGKDKFPVELRSVMEPALQYEYRQLMRGQDARDRLGTRHPVRIETRLLFTYDRYGRLIAGAGLLSRINGILKQLGCDISYEDVTPVHPRPDRFTEDWDNVVRNFKFRPRQDEALVQIASNYRGIVDAPTGFGKTFTYKAIGLLYPRARILITTKRRDLVEGIRSELAKDLPNIGQIGGGVNRPGRITVVTADSLHRADPDEVDILIGEEVHELAAPSYAVELSKFRFCRMYGFSATPTGRMDNADMKLESLFGPIIFRMTYQEAVALGLVVPIDVRWLSVRMDNPAAGKVDVPRLRWGIWRNQVRNEIIAAAAREFGPDEQTLIMVTTFEHAVHLRQHLPDFTLCYAERSDDGAFNDYVKKGMLPETEPEMTPARREMLRKQFESGALKKVIATDVWSTGVSFEQLSVMIRADARGSEIMDSQIPGRVCRIHEESGKRRGLVLDCLDEFDANFRNAARKRRQNYEAKGWGQIMPAPSRL